MKEVVLYIVVNEVSTTLDFLLHIYGKFYTKRPIKLQTQPFTIARPKFNRPVVVVVNDIAGGVGGTGFDYWAGQIGHKVADESRRF